MSGRPRKPVEAKILEGTFRADKDGDPTTFLAPGEPVPPPHLKGPALEFWGEVVPGLVALGVARAADAPALAEMCTWYARYRKLARAFDRAKVGPGNSGLMMQMGVSFDKFNGLAARFGLTPSDRAKLRVAEKPAGGVPTRKRG
jgi:phage terminase small subunit